MRPAVSVVIPTYNRLARLQRVLGALGRQTCAPDRYEVVVVSDGSTDGTDEYLRSEAARGALVFATQANRGPAAARNRGVDLAQGELVLFIDDDVIATPGLLEQHLLAHERDGGRGDELVVIGPMLTPPDFAMSAWVRWEQTMLAKQYQAMQRGDYGATFRQFYTGNASLSRQQLLNVGGFDTRFRRAEDVELAYRLDEAGARFEFDSAAIGYHYAERSFPAWRQNAYDYGANDVTFAREHPRNRILEMVGVEFGHRHPLVRWVTRTCLTRPRLRAAAGGLFRVVATAAEAAGARSVGRAALSGIYNLTYYQGMADELGGAGAFRRLMVGETPTSVAVESDRP